MILFSKNWSGSTGGWGYPAFGGGDGGGGGGDTAVNYEVTFKASGLDVVTFGSSALALNGGLGYDFSDFSAGAMSPEMAAAEAEIQAYIDANGGGVVTLSYPGQSTMLIQITLLGDTAVSADDNSNPGPHTFAVV